MCSLAHSIDWGQRQCVDIECNIASGSVVSILSCQRVRACRTLFVENIKRGWFGLSLEC